MSPSSSESRHPSSKSSPANTRPSLFARVMHPMALTDASAALRAGYEERFNDLAQRLREALAIVMGQRDTLKAEVEELRERLNHAEGAIRQMQRHSESSTPGVTPVRKVGVGRSTLRVAR